MIDETPAHRFYGAARRATARIGLGDRVGDFLLRVGLAGLMARLEVEPTVHIDQSLLRAQKLHHVLVLEHAQRVSEVFVRRELPHFFAKGVALAGTVYEPGDRFIGDIDLYVPYDTRGEAVRTLEELGYYPLPENDQAGPPELRSALALEFASDNQMDRIGVDLHWALDPVERLLPRCDRPIPQEVWDNVRVPAHFNLPQPEHHAAVLVHHIVHTDLLHIRSLLDLAFVFQQFADEGGSDYLRICDRLRLGVVGGALAVISNRDLGVARPNAEGRAWESGGFLQGLNLEKWLMIVAKAGPDDYSRITPGRIRRRMRVLGVNAVKTLIADLVSPPAEFLTWRWGTAAWRARLRHYSQLMRKLYASKHQ